MPNMLVSRFFRVYTQWRWPNPVMLCAIEEGSLGLQIWDPRRNHKDKYHLMPIITPAFSGMNSSYNVSASTLRIMTEEFKRGHDICEAMVLNNGSWLELFEPYRFFEAYRNYLQIDISAVNDDDMMNWKGWVKSRIRYLLLKIERDTFKMLQCHPHPGDFSDRSNPFHCSYFLGLQQKERVPANETKMFDIRLTVDEFKANVGSYTSWKPGMDINVTHIKRRDIPAFVFPSGIRPTRPVRMTVERRRQPETSATSSVGVEAGTFVDVNVNFVNGTDDDDDDDTRKRKREEDDVSTKSTAPKLMINEGFSNTGLSVGGPSGTVAVTSALGGDCKGIGTSEVKTDILDQNNEDSTVQLTLREEEKLAIEKLMTGPYESHQTSQQELEELEELDNNNNNNNSRDRQLAGTSNTTDTTSGLEVNGSVEELEAPELDVPLNESRATSQKKPVIRFNFTSLAKSGKT